MIENLEIESQGSKGRGLEEDPRNEHLYSNIFRDYFRFELLDEKHLDK